MHLRAADWTHAEIAELLGITVDVGHCVAVEWQGAAACLRRLKDADLLRVVDLVVVAKDADGEVATRAIMAVRFTQLEEAL